MEYLFRSLKTESIPELGYRAFLEAKHAIKDYIVGYFSLVRPHQHNKMLPPDQAEKLYWKNYKTVASFT